MSHISPNFLPNYQPWVTIIYFIDLLLLDISFHKWNRTTYTLLWLVSFTKHIIFKIHPHWNMKSTSFLFIAEEYHIVCLHHVIYPSTNQLMCIYQGCSYFFGITNNAAMNIHGHVFRFFWVYLEDKLLSHMVTLFQST